MTDSQDKPRSAGFLKSRRSALLAGAFGLSLMGFAAGQPVLLPDILPAFAQEAPPQTPPSQTPPAQVEPPRTPEDQRTPEQQSTTPEDQRAKAPIVVERPANAPASFAPMVAQVRRAVVSVRVENGRRTRDSLEQFGLPEDHPWFRFFRRFGERDRRGLPRGFAQAQGSGFFISADGFIVTNNHVVERGDRVEIVTDDGKTYRARVVGVDDRTDIAVLKVDGNGAFPHVRFSRKNPEVGDWVVAIGNPFGLGGTVTAGIVSARGRDINAGAYDDFIQIDAPINRGNSGGPAFNLDGEVIGINTAIYTPSGGSVGIGFAIPAEIAERVVSDLRENGEVTRGWLGVSIQPVTEDIAESLGLKDTRGAVVAEPQADGPAQKAGIRARDVIVSVNGQEVQTPRDLSRKIAALEPGARAEIGYMRNGRRETVTIELGRLPAERQADARSGEDEQDDRQTSRSAPSSRLLDDLGLMLESAPRGGKGVVVAEVERGSRAEEKGLREGDVILEVGDAPVSTPEDVARALADAERENRKAVMLRVRTGERIRLVALALKAS